MDVRKRRQAKPEGINGIRKQDLQKWLRLGSKRTSGRIVWKTIGLEIMKKIAGSSIRIRKMRDWTLWRGEPLLKRKKNLDTE
jgi:hypothetical protein